MAENFNQALDELESDIVSYLNIHSFAALTANRSVPNQFWPETSKHSAQNDML